ncbi:MAG TPA: hypothetical protein VFS43_20490 [Polyangiaceae bacterium]|nr:hypothetical protein [Polyangiaceae bacterium]
MPRRKVGHSPVASLAPLASSGDSANSSPASGTSAGPVLRAWYLLVERVELDQDDQARRTQLMAELAQLLHAPAFPASLRAEAMGLMGKLARRSQADSPCQRGLVIMKDRFSSRHGRCG